MIDYVFLSKTPLFHGSKPDEIKSMLNCLGAAVRQFESGSVIFHAGDTTESMGLVLSGAVTIESIDLNGKKSILGHNGPGELFAETYACIPGEPLMVDVCTSGQTEILFLHAQRMLTTCPHGCSYHRTLIRSLLAVTAKKNLALSQRMLYTAPRSIRERLISYLSSMMHRSGSPSFTIPFDRQQLADYLNVDRSALSHELSKMTEEGILTTNKNYFVLKTAEL
jgi:CRP/FNR family transcriptional regulator, dissimilatory nitrate respiration regulator